MSIKYADRANSMQKVANFGETDGVNWETKESEWTEREELKIEQSQPGYDLTKSYKFMFQKIPDIADGKIYPYYSW